MVRNNGMIYFRWLRWKYQKLSKNGLSEATNHQESDQISNSQLNNNKMKAVKFNLEQYNTGKHQVVTEDGREVKIGLIDPTERAAILGWINGFACHWDINGNYLTNKASIKSDLRLLVAPEVVYITITRNPEGKINVYGTVEGEPRVMGKSTLLKRLEVELD
jgi:hypothetical protein